MPYPEGTRELDFGLGIAAVIGADGAIGGLTLANDWTARDLERAERESGFGPVEEQGLRALDRPGARNAWTSSEHRGRDDRARERRGARALELGELAYSWQELADHAARNTLLRPGELLVCSTGGSDGPWLRAGRRGRARARRRSACCETASQRRRSPANTPFGECSPRNGRR